MDLMHSPFKQTLLLLMFLVTITLVLASGCRDNVDVVVVDFSETVTVAQVEDRSTDDRVLRVAVGAMISPKETFIYYHQLLAYIGSRLDQKVELIQRRTYGEISELFNKGLIEPSSTIILIFCILSLNLSGSSSSASRIIFSK